MKLGIKVSLQPYSYADLRAVRPPAAEVWFNITRADEYDGLFATLKQLNVETGLHFWGALPDGTMANIAYPDTALNQASIALMRQAIDIAAAHGFVYVNIHPGQRSKVKVDFAAMNYPSVSKPTGLTGATNNFLENARGLTGYAADRGVIFTVETVSRLSPATRWYDPASRLTPINIYDLPIEVNLAAARAGLFIANDFVHTATHSPSDKPGDVWQFLKTKTRDLAAQTRLIHLGFLVPPYNGVDNHDMLDNPVFRTADAIPNRVQMKELFTYFKDTNVWVITEPRSDHAKNYRLAQKLLAEIR